MKVGIIGFGRLGKLITKYLAKDFDVFVYDKNLDTKSVKEFNATSASLKEACSSKIVIPSVPISEFEGCLLEMVPFLNENTLVIDVCSVKCHPISAMERHLPDNVQILGTHPMFGPDSAAKSLFGAKIVLCKVRIDDDKYQDIHTYLESHGLKVIEATAKKHDKDISSSLYSHILSAELLWIFELKICL